MLFYKRNLLLTQNQSVAKLKLDLSCSKILNYFGNFYVNPYCFYDKFENFILNGKNISSGIIYIILRWTSDKKQQNTILPR